LYNIKAYNYGDYQKNYKNEEFLVKMKGIITGNPNLCAYAKINPFSFKCCKEARPNI